MQAATSSYSWCTGRGSSWYPSVEFAVSAVVPLPHDGGTFPGRVSLLCFILQNRPFPAENQQPRVKYSGSKSWGKEICQECSSLWQRTVGTSWSWKKPPALHSLSLLVGKWRLVHVPLLSVEYQPEKKAQDLTGGWWWNTRVESVSPCTKTEHLLNAYPSGCCLSYRTASVSISRGHQLSQTLAAGCELFISKLVNAPLPRKHLRGPSHQQ